VRCDRIAERRYRRPRIPCPEGVTDGGPERMRIMSDYEQSIKIDAPPDEVFAFVSNLSNIPRYLPSVSTVASRGAERLRVRGDTAGQYAEVDGWFNVHPTEYFMEWSADTARHYSGWLQVEELDGVSEVTVHLSYMPDQSVARTMADNIGEIVENGLQAALESIKNIVEGRVTLLDSTDVLWPG
jgi:uncharacterized membrane protein